MMRKALKSILRFGLRSKVRPAIIQLTSHDNLMIKAIGEAVQETINNIISEEEKMWINLIEQRRGTLLFSDKEINVIDYGAGSPNSNRTKDEMEKGIIGIEKISDICKASKSKFWATILFKLIRKIEPLSCVELGACVGISTAYQAAALNINGKGNIITIEGSPEIANIAQETIDMLHLSNASVVVGPFQNTLKQVLESAKPIDFFYNDGHHDHDAVIKYYNDALPYFSNEAVVVLDDISWSEGMKTAWSKIKNDANVIASIDLWSVGIVLIGDNEKHANNFKIPLI